MAKDAKQGLVFQLEACSASTKVSQLFYLDGFDGLDEYKYSVVFSEYQKWLDGDEHYEEWW